MSILNKKDGQVRGEPVVLQEMVPDEVQAVVTEYREMQDFLFSSVKMFLGLIKDFSLDLKELNADKFKGDLDTVSEKFFAEKKLRRLEGLLDRYNKIVPDYITRLAAYMQDREGEFKKIIDLLTKAIVTLNEKNQDFNQKVYENSEKFEKITLLDDIKKIKASLEMEIAKLRETLNEKAAEEAEDIKLLSSKVDSLRVELVRAKKESERDGLTGAFNRRAYDNYMMRVLDEAKDGRYPFALLMIDVDKFKHINDEFGHQIGDRALLTLVQLCRKNIRSNDFVARYGGDEFVIVLPDASLRNAKKKAQAICKKVAASRFSLDEIKKGVKLTFTVSIGVATHRSGDSMSSLSSRADKALYIAKRSGKNRVALETEIQG